MGKTLKGKECGKGIYQRKDGLYSARYYTRDGSRRERYFNTLPEARNWLADAKYEDRHNLTVVSSDMTVDAWFDYWMNNLICDLAPSTRRSNSFSRRSEGPQRRINTVFFERTWK